jgi:hypothetical protein
VAMTAPSLSAWAQDASVFKPTAETPVIDSAVPTDQEDLFNYLKSGTQSSRRRNPARIHLVARTLILAGPSAFSWARLLMPHLPPVTTLIPLVPLSSRKCLTETVTCKDGQ